ncbi:alpha/beta hydrolase [Pseudoxanthomonas broegbernensis]|uniref:Alpha/beta hydrolase n=1 Tax=Pseudoxanthomonas broegbernensis TaxID=83619 RepID=A0A7V8K6U8_9GAMM|nr:alpha/beta fold hydrolase [Pseudoxanthomonas broegbernensis]KAF1686330.1 alpha/beta hydrolase [Pseudoxanthomonas broegbernensis]MBB6064017.1 hypothetical protein [Pseudoxanthomonas broegbernensis]
MDVELDRLDIEVAQGDAVQATVLVPQRELPGALFVHGWGGSQGQDLSRAREVAGLGCVCLTFDLRGHRANAARKDVITRGQNLQDLCAAYDWLAGRPHVDAAAIAVVGVSYGGYLAAILSELRPVQWLALRTPALYLDRDWELPKKRLHDDPELARYRRQPVAPQDNRALRACARFGGDVLLVEAEHDRIIPRQVIDNYAGAFGKARSMTRRLIRDADHGFSEKAAQRGYTDVLMAWMTEMVVGSRGAIAADKVRADKQERRVRAPA